MQSPYFHERYMDQSFEADICCTGRMPYVLAAESDLIRAEAIVRTHGNKQTAADLINNTRVGRGKLPPILATASDDEFYKDILYEREVETDATDGFGFFALRHEDELQAGTLRHLPVPATELENLGLPIYTFGGVGNPVESVTPAGAVHKLLGSMNSRPTMDLALPNGSVMKLQVPQTAGPARLPATRH
jgi:hypothetical protein